MKLLTVAAVIALAFTTGFTCSKNTPSTEQPVVEESVTVETTETLETAPVDGQPVPTETPAEGTTH